MHNRNKNRYEFINKSEFVRTIKNYNPDDRVYLRISCITKSLILKVSNRISIFIIEAIAEKLWKSGVRIFVNGENQNISFKSSERPYSNCRKRYKCSYFKEW